MALNPIFARATNVMGRALTLTSGSVRGPITTSLVRNSSSESAESNQFPMPEKGSEKCLNSVTLLGRVGVDPQLRGNERHPVVVFSLATNLRYKSAGPDGGDEWKTKTDWHNIAVFKPKLLDSVHQTVSKGHRVMVQGRLMYGEVEDKAGITRHTTTIVAEDVIRFAA